MSVLLDRILEQITPEPHSAAVALMERILEWSEWEPNSGCLLWVGCVAISRSGAPYPRFRFQGRKEYVYRVVFDQLVESIRPGYTIDHTCKVTLCVRPSHLEQLTMQQNQLRSNGMAARYAQRTHCQNGHLFDYLFEGKRRCRTCDRDRQRARRALLAQEAAAYAPRAEDVEVSFP